MGQAWCKEKTSKAQDSKSPLDRVFVRCAHRIYPSWKEEGSVLGGATQRVTSSEIGYAGSPPREVLTRGRSIDSVDRPFHPSDWVDVNLEVPSTPRASSVLTNLTVDTSLYPATTPTSSCSNLKDATPVPPPRRRKRNRGRPLPPKPDEAAANAGGNPRKAETREEPLYSSVKSPKSSGDEHENEEEARNDKSSAFPDGTKHEVKRAKEIYEHKVNGTGRIISSDVVSGKRTSSHEERKGRRNGEAGQQHRRSHEIEEYERFVRNQSVKDSSTPNRQDRRKSKDHEKQIKDPAPGDSEKPETRTKNYSTVSLPNYDELEVARHAIKRSNDQEEGGGEKTKSRRPVRSSTGSLPAESFLSPFSEKTSVRLEDYIPRRGSSENLSAYQVLGKLDRAENGAVDGGFVKYDPSKLEDWDLGDIGNCELNYQRRRRRPSVEEHPSRTFATRELSTRNETKEEKKENEEEEEEEEEDVVDFSRSNEIEDNEGRFLGGREISDRAATESPLALQKPEAFGKTPSPILDEEENSRRREDVDWILGQNRSHLRYFEPPTLAETCTNSMACETKSTSREPFFLDEAKHRSALDTIGGSGRNDGTAADSDRGGQSRMIFGRSLSNESEPNEEPYESKDLRGNRQGIAVTSLVRTISEESLPREMAEVVDRELDDFFEEKTAKDARNKMRKDCVQETTSVKTPPPSPEPKIKAEILDNDHSTLLKVLKEEAEGSNLSSMTPSLTELEAALSDMLEKEETQEETRSQDIKLDETKSYVERSSVEKPIEPEIVPVEKNSSSFEDGSRNEEVSSRTMETRIGRTDGSLVVERIEEETVSLGQILEGSKSPLKTRKVSFCAWEESRALEDEFRDDREVIGPEEKDLDKTISSQTGESNVSSEEETRTYHGDVPPEKPSRLHRNLEDLVENVEFVPTPPRRKNKGSSGVATTVRKEIETAQNGSAIADPYPNDRLI